MRLACLPVGGWWPEIVFCATWLLLVIMTAAAAVPPMATKSASVATTLAYVSRRRMPRPILFIVAPLSAAPDRRRAMVADALSQVNGRPRAEASVRRVRDAPVRQS